MKYNWQRKQNKKIPIILSLTASFLVLVIGIPVSYAFFNGDTTIKGNDISAATFGIETKPDGITILGSDKNKGPKKHDSITIENIGSIPLQMTVKDSKVSDNCSPYVIAYKIKSKHGLLSQFTPVTIEDGKHQKLRIMFEKGTDIEEDISCTVDLTLVAWQVQFNEPNKGFVVKKQITLNLELKSNDANNGEEVPTESPTATPTPSDMIPSESPTPTPSESPSVTPTSTTTPTELPQPTITSGEPSPTELPAPTATTSD